MTGRTSLRFTAYALTAAFFVTTSFVPTSKKPAANVKSPVTIATDQSWDVSGQPTKFGEYPLSAGQIASATSPLHGGTYKAVAAEHNERSKIIPGTVPIWRNRRADSEGEAYQFRKTVKLGADPIKKITLEVNCDDVARVYINQRLASADKRDGKLKDGYDDWFLFRSVSGFMYDRIYTYDVTDYFFTNVTNTILVEAVSLAFDGSHAYLSAKIVIEFDPMPEPPRPAPAVKPAKAKPAAKPKAKAEKPASAEATVGKPASAEATVGKPASAEDTVGKPASAEATVGKPASAEATAGKPASAEATVGKPASAEATAGKEKTVFEAGRDPEIEKLHVGSILELGHVYFKADDYRLDTASYRTLDALATFMKRHPSLKVEVGGHTNLRPGDRFATELSTNRARSVMRYLTDNGVATDRVTYKGYGKSRPRVNALSKEADRANQRVEVKVLEK